MAKVVTEKAREKKPRTSLEKPSIWELGGLSWWQLLKRLWTSMDSNHDDSFGRAAELAYFFFLAVFPGLLFLMTVLGIVAGNNESFRTTLFSYAAQALPPSAWELVQKTISETAKSATGWKVALGILGALWSASAGTSTLMTVLNFAYHVKERRSWLRTRFVIAPLLTIALAGLLLGALGIILSGLWTSNWAAAHGFGTAAIIWRIIQWPIAFCFVVFAFALLYFFAPDVEDQKWYWITPGSIIGVMLWVAASAGFRAYLHFFNSYSATYGSLGAVIILMLWFYITGLTLLIGAEANAEIEHAAAEHGRADAKLKGEKEAPAA
ncbi:MAG TPA: YihY/virulence factor BrkB family protein [Terriglobales bacterium]|nr:YihY/virulence factor BrkB family protein [Terriglobales bacterium]